MITKQHAAITLMALALEGREQEFRKLIPWVLLPDAIRGYIPPRQASHFEKTSDGKDISWMYFPSSEQLKKLTKENAKEMIGFYQAKTPPCVIGELTHLPTFDYMNVGHEFYHALRAHLRQDCILDAVLRDELVDVKERFLDVFTIKHSGKRINGKELRTQLALFEELGFIKLVGMVFDSTGILLDSDWFEENVYEPLKEAYPTDLAENTYRYMIISDEDNERLNQLEFTLTEEEKASVKIADKVDDLWQNMYESALAETFIEFG